MTSSNLLRVDALANLVTMSLGRATMKTAAFRSALRLAKTPGLWGVCIRLSDRTLDRVFGVRVRKFQRSRAYPDVDQDRQQAAQNSTTASGRYHRHLHDRQADVNTHRG